MAQAQLQYGFLESSLQLDRKCTITIKKGDQPEMEFNQGGKKFSLNKDQWETLCAMATNIHLAFSLVTNSTITPVDSFSDLIQFDSTTEPKRKQKRKAPINKPVGSQTISSPKKRKAPITKPVVSQTISSSHNCDL